MCVTTNLLLVLNVSSTTNWPDRHGSSKGKVKKLFAPWTRLCWLRWNDSQHTVYPLTMSAGLSASQRWQWIWADRVKSWSDFLSFHRRLGLYEVYDRSVIYFKKKYQTLYVNKSTDIYLPYAWGFQRKILKTSFSVHYGFKWCRSPFWYPKSRQSILNPITFVIGEVKVLTWAST